MITAAHNADLNIMHIFLQYIPISRSHTLAVIIVFLQIVATHSKQDTMASLYIVVAVRSLHSMSAASTNAVKASHCNYFVGSYYKQQTHMNT